MSKNKRKNRDNDRMCPRCRVSPLVPAGYALDGRPQYECQRCRIFSTYGGRGYDWDDRKPRGRFADKPDT